MQIQLSDFPEYRELLGEFSQMKAELAQLREALPEWVDQVEAERLTGLSDTTLWRERQKPHSLIQWKSDRGVRYLRASLLAYNSRHVVRRGTSPTPSKH